MYQRVATRPETEEGEMAVAVENHGESPPGYSEISQRHTSPRIYNNTRNNNNNNNNNNVSYTDSSHSEEDQDDHDERLAGSVIHHPLAKSNNNNNIGPSEAAGDDRFLINILCHDSSRKQDIPCDASWSVSDLKKAVFATEIQQGNAVRLIFQGMVMDDARLLRSYSIPPKAWLHSVVTPRPPDAAGNPSGARAEAGGGGGGGGGGGVASGDVVIPINSPHGFDDPPPAPEGNNSDFLTGIAMGLVFGGLALVCVWQRWIPRKQRLGIVVGIMINVYASFSKVTIEKNLMGSSTGVGANIGGDGSTGVSSLVSSTNDLFGGGSDDQSLFGLGAGLAGGPAGPSTTDVWGNLFTGPQALKP